MAKKSKGTIWERIEEALRDAGYTRGLQTTVAKWCGIKQPSVSLWKSDKTTPEVKYILVIAEKLGVCVEWLYMGRGPKRPGENLPPDLAELADFWERLPPEVRADIRGYAKLKRSMTFTGDPGERKAYEESLPVPDEEQSPED